MSKFNPDFWEVTLSEAGWDRFSDRDHPFYEADDEREERHQRDDRARHLRCALEAVINDVLTDRQCEVVMLYFFEELNQREIAERLDVSQQVVSEHLYGKRRNGKVVGGALRKLRKVCAKRGIAWP